MTPFRWYYLKIFFLFHIKMWGLSFVTKPWRELHNGEREQIFKMVCQVYRDEKKYADSSLTHEEVKDVYDAKAIYFLAFQKEKLLGFARLVPHTLYGFQTANWLPLQIPSHVNQSRLAEISRFIVTHEYRGGRRFVALGLIRSLFIYGRRKKLSHFLAILPHTLLVSFTKLGIPHELVSYGDPEEHHLEAQRKQKALAHYLKKVDFRVVLFPIIFIP